MATSAELHQPTGVAVDSAGNLYIADYYNFRIRKVDAATGIITTVAGNGTSGYAGDGGPATSAEFVSPGDVVIDSVGNMYIADYPGSRIRKVAAGTGIITTVAGNGTAAYSGDGGLAIDAELDQPMTLALDSADNLYIADQYNNRIRRIAAATGIITTVAGDGTGGYTGDGGPATSAEIYMPAGVAVDSAGNLYIGDQFNHRVRKVDAGTGVITTLVGTGTSGFSGDGGPANIAEVASPVGVSLDSTGNLYVSDYGNNRIRQVNISQSALIYPTATTVGTSDATDDPQTAIVSNIGNATLTIPPPSTGYNPSVAANFTFASSSTCPQLGTSTGAQTLALGASCTIAIDFAPSQAGSITGTSIFTDTSLNAVSATQTIQLTATGVAASTTTTLSSSLNPSAYSQSVTFTATVAPTVGTSVPTGTVAFSVGGVVVDSAVTLNGSGVATFTTSTLAVGTDSVTAAYTPSSTDFTASSATALSQVVNKATLGQNGLANVTLTSSPNPSGYGQSVIFTATVPTGATGTVTFIDGTTTLGTATLSGAIATFTTSTLAVGTHSVTAVYSGDANFNTATSAVDSQVVNSSAFPPTPVGTTSAAQNIYVTIPATETITSISIPQSQGGMQEYTIGSITGCTVGASNPAGTVCTISITFTPETPGQRWVPLQVVASGGNFNVGLTGIGLGPLVALTPGIITTAAGNGTAGYAGDGGLATAAELNSPVGAVFDSAGNLYIGDNANSRVRKVNAVTGTITTVAGNGTAGYSGDGGAATSAELNGPEVVALDSAGNLYIAEYYNNRIRKVDAATGIITTVAGNGTQNYSGDGGLATSAALWSPTGVALDSAGNLYIADFGNHRIRKVDATTGIITTIAGNGTQGFSGDGGLATSAELGDPTQVILDSAGNLIIADPGNNRVRKVDVTTGIITTIAGNGTGGYAGDGGLATSAELHNPEYLTIDSAGNLYIGDYLNNRVREVNAATGIITTIAGNGTGAYAGDGGAATSAELQYPSSIAFDNAGNLYVSDLGNSRIRKLDLSQSALAYPTATEVGTTDATDDPQTAIVSNIGNVSLTIPPPGTGNNPNVSLNFALNTATTCPQLTTGGSAQTLAAGATCSYAVNFAPTTAGAITGSAVVTDNSLNILGSTQTINLSGTGIADTTTTTLTSSLNPSAYTQSVTFTATVAATVGTTVPAGTVQFSIDGVVVGGPVTLNGSGVATFTTSTLAVGTHSVTAAYTPGTTGFSGSNAIALSQVVNKATLGQNGLANITLTSSPNPSTYNQSVDFTATVPSGVAGSVQFIDGSTVLGTATITGTTAVLTTSTLAVGTDPVAAVYGGSADYNTATSAVDNQVVTTVASSTTTLSIAPSTVMYGNPATLTAVVAPSFATGTVSFYSGSMLLGTASVDNTGTAVLPISTLNAGVYNIVATYNGDPIVPASTSNTAQLTVTQRSAPGGGPAITITVNNAARTTTQANPPFTYSAAGQLVNGDTYATAISGTATYATTAGSTPGTFSIAVTGLTSTNYSIAFVPGNLTVTISPSTTTLVASPTSPQYGNPVTLTATVTSGATGTASFYDGSVLLGTGTVSGGVATLTTSTLVAGTHTITAVYNGDATYASSQSAPATVTVAKATAPGGGAALTITVQNASRPYGTSDPQFSYVITGTLVNGDSYATAVTGTPTYATTDTPTSSAGSTFPINLSGLSSANYTIAIVPGTLTIVSESTTTTLTTSTNATQYGDPVTLTATVVPSGATGTVVFMNGSTVLGTATVTGGVATLATSSLSAGTYTITSSYEGDTDYGASTSGPVALTINPRSGPGGTAALTVTVGNASRPYGQGNPAFSYSVTGTLVNGDTYATAVTGVPVYTTTATPASTAGTYPISVAGLNSSNYVTAFVNGTLTVTTSASVPVVTIGPSAPVAGQPVTITATVPTTGTTAPTGTVTFYYNGTPIGTGTLNASGVATLTTGSLPVGAGTITVGYSGDGNYASSTSAPVPITIAQVLDFTLTLTSAQSETVTSGQAAPYTVQVAPTSSVYPGIVTFTATGLPSGAVATFTPTTVAADAGPAIVNVSIQTASLVAINKLKSNATSIALGLLLLPLAGIRRMRKSGRVAGRYLFMTLVLLAGAVATTGLTGCGANNGFFGHAPQTYNITITATSGSIQHSVNATLTVE